jgi:hypothetical protein
MRKNEVFHASNQVGNFDDENQRFSISVFSRLIILVLFQVIASLIMRSEFPILLFLFDMLLAISSNRQFYFL